MQGPGSELGAAWSACSWKIGGSEEGRAFGPGLYCVASGCIYSPAGCSTEHGSQRNRGWGCSSVSRGCSGLSYTPPTHTALPSPRPSLASILEACPSPMSTFQLLLDSTSGSLGRNHKAGGLLGTHNSNDVSSTYTICLYYVIGLTKHIHRSNYFISHHTLYHFLNEVT